MTTMQELFAQVLNHKDLSKAGDLFSVADKDIENDLSEVNSFAIVSVSNSN